jgi:hypothetical protein
VRPHAHQPNALSPALICRHTGGSPGVLALDHSVILLYGHDRTLRTPKSVRKIQTADSVKEHFKEAPMSASPVTMEELELESAELLPNRETLCSGGSYHPGHSVSFTQVGYGNTAQAGLVNVSALNGSFDNILSLGSGNIL